MEQERTLTRVYGIYFMADKNETKKINEALAKNESSLFYIPKKSRMRIYFRNFVEASKVANYLNGKQNGRFYSIFPTAVESLEHVKGLYEKDKKIRKHAPIMYYRLTTYQIYDTAEDYFATLKDAKDDRKQAYHSEEDYMAK